MSLQNLTLKTIGLCINFYALLNRKKAGYLSFSLFCLPMSKKLKTYEAEFLNKAKFKTLDYGDKLIQVYHWGEGSRAILLVHGWASHSFRWKSYVEALVQNQYSVYAFDAPAHGMSQGRMLTLPMYSSIIDNLNEDLGGFQAIIGHSFGGYAIINWLNAKPQNKELKTVILAAPGEVSDFMDMYQRKLGLSDKVIQEIETEFKRITNKTPADFSAPLLAKDFNYACLIIHDRNDNDASYHYSERLNERWKGSQLILTNGLGHKLKSKDVLKSVIKFLR